MRKLINSLFAFAIFVLPFTASAYNGAWTKLDPAHVPSKADARMHPSQYLVYSLNTGYFKDLLFSLSDQPQNASVIELPMPDGSFRDFKVWQSAIMPAELSTKYPGIKTFTAIANDDPTVHAKLDFTEFGFHAMIFDGEKTAFIDPYSNIPGEGLYMCHYKKDETRAANDRMQCLTKNNSASEIIGNATQVEQPVSPSAAAKTVNAYSLRTYRLALSCSHQYATSVCSPNAATKPLTLSAMVTTMNRVNGVYEWELSITMQLVPNEDTLIFIVAAGDPFNFDNNNAVNLLDDNQTVCDARIGNANYDIGHVFTTGSGGLSNLGIVCETGGKAGSTTGSQTPTGDGFDIDYVAHEMGHEFGANHTFNNDNNGSCGGNAWQPTAYEPGSGSTIMAYAGICSPDDIQPHSDDYFHPVNLQEIYVATIVGTSCAAISPNANRPSSISPFTATYTIPYKTPFELMSPGAVDSVYSVTTYDWEQWNLGDFTSALYNTYKYGPIFRSFKPVISTVRVFPRIDSVLKGALSYVTVENKKGEKAPDTARILSFKLTLRNAHYGKGAFTILDDSIHLDVVSTGTAGAYQGFKVTSPSTAVNWTGGTSQNITWNVVGTNAAPVNCTDVNVYLSTDGGYTWPYFIATVPNNGAANVTIPNVATTTTARLKVKGNNNVFFNVNGSNFTVTFDPSLPVTQPNNPINQTIPYLAVNSLQQAQDDIVIYPVPAGDLLNVEAGGNYDIQVYNNVGQFIWKGQMTNKTGIQVHSWAKGVYYMQLTNHENGKRIVKPVLIK